MDPILQQESPTARAYASHLTFWAISLVYFFWPYHDVPTFLLVGKLLFLPPFFILGKEILSLPKKHRCLYGLFAAGLGYLFWAYYSVSWSVVPWRTFKHVSEEVLFNLIVFITAMFWSYKAPWPQVKRLVRYVSFSFLFSILVYFLFYAWWFWKGPLFPVEGSPPHADPLSLLFLLSDWNDLLLNRQNLASYFLFPASMALGYLLYHSERKKFLKGFFFFLLSVGMIFITSKRSALLGLFVGGLVGGVLTKRFKVLGLWICFFAFVLALIVATPLKRFFVRENFYLLFHGNREAWKTAGSIPMRYYGLPYYLNYIKKHLWKGIGFGRFNIKKNPVTRALARKAHLAHAHNVFLNMVLHLGIVGALAFVSFLFFKLWCLLKGLFSREGPENWLLLGFFIYFLAFWIRYQFDDSFHYATSALYYLNTGLGVGLALKSQSSHLLSSR